MADKQTDPKIGDQRYYSAHMLNIVFTVASLLFLGAMLLMFWKDYDREWRGHQKAFRAVELEKAQAALTAEEKHLREHTDFIALSNTVSTLEAAAETQQSELDTLETEQKKTTKALAVAMQALNFEKAEASATRYQLEASHSGHSAKTESLAADYKKRLVAVDAKSDSVDGLQAELERISESIEALTSALSNARNELGRATLQRELLALRLAKLDPSKMDAATRIGDTVRDLPLLDALNPRYNIRDHQLIVEGVTEDLIFDRVPRVDRCTVCHLGIDKKGFEDQPNPFKTHPNVDLFLGLSSPHPLKEFGCTSCHSGRGRGTSFTSAAHTPSSPEQAAEWKEKYGWKALHHWDTPMRPAPYTEAGCFECHSGASQTKSAETLNLGLAVVERAGCYGCHQIEKYEDRSRVGPSLRHVADKVSPEWAYHWLNDPKAFREHTWMPSFFNQSNNADMKERTDQEAGAMIQYLIKESSDYKTPHSTMPTGNPERGLELANSLGCQGCHMLEGESYPDKLTLNSLRRQQGPNLTGLGTKTTALWVYNWLKDPKSYHPETRMPNLRLSDQEAADTAAYLVSSHKADFAKTPIPAADADVLDAIALEFMVPGMTRTRARKKLATMPIDEKQQYAGSKLIRRYGCFACHEIPGFEDARPIGTELTEIASKSVSKLDFGLRHDLPHVNYAWFEEKLRNPRAFDEGMVKSPKDKLRMPNFDLEPEAVTAVVTALLGFTKPDEELTKMVPRTPKNLFVEKGEALIGELNCRGCHELKGDGGAIHGSVAYWLEHIRPSADAEEDAEEDEDDWGEEEESDVDLEAIARAYNPPNLTGEGAKVQPAWLFHFLQTPETIRPWLSLRMPSYGLNDEQLNTLTAFFSYDADTSYPFASSPTVDTNSATYAAGRDMFSPQSMSCARCHIAGGRTPIGSTEDNWAPDLAKAHDRLRADWILQWLEDPQSLEPGTKMPMYWAKGEASPVTHLDGDPQRQREAVREYIQSLGK